MFTSRSQFFSLKMKKVTITTGTESDFFVRGRLISKAADAGETFEQELILTFEDFEDLRKLISPARLNLLRSIMKEPATIAEISERLNRSRRAVIRDVNALVLTGLIEASYKINPGHGQAKVLSAKNQHIRLSVDIF